MSLSNDNQPKEDEYRPNTLLQLNDRKLWTYNYACPNYDNKCHLLSCPHSPEKSTSTEVRHIQSQLISFKCNQRNIVSLNREYHVLPTYQKEYATYNHISSILENTYLLNPENDSKQNYRNLLSQKTCRHYGEVVKGYHSPRCQKIHHIKDILLVFSDVKLIDFYKNALIRVPSKEKPVDFLVRDVGAFQCLTQQSQCKLNIYFYTYTVDLMAKYNNELIYPTCILTCDFCRQSRSVVIYK